MAANASNGNNGGKGKPPPHEHFLLKDLDTGMKSYVTDQEWVEKPSSISLITTSQQHQQHPSQLPPLPPVQQLPPRQTRPLQHYPQPPNSSSSNFNSNLNNFRQLSDLNSQEDNSQQQQGEGGFLKSRDQVRVLSHKKRDREFSNLYRWQTLRAHQGPIRVMEFNSSGQWLATAGADTYIKIWEIDHKLEDAPPLIKKTSNIHTYIRNASPFLTCQGHTSDVTALSWSKNDFLLSGSLDHTIRLWHPTSKTCIRRLIQSDMITSVSFHPTDEQICICGTSSGKLTMWQLKDNQLLSTTDIDDMITCTSITPDGTTALVGTLHGRCKFYALFDEIQGEWQFKHTTQLDVRSSRRKKSNHLGRKICGFKFFDQGDKVLVSSNDSRLRLYRLDDKSVVCKFTGCVLEFSRLNGCFDPDFRFVMCAGEERKVHIWDLRTDDTTGYDLLNSKYNYEGKFDDEESDSDEDDEDDEDEEDEEEEEDEEDEEDKESYTSANDLANDAEYPNTTALPHFPQPPTSQQLLQRQIEQQLGKTSIGAQTRKDVGSAFESFTVQDHGHVTAAVFAPNIIAKQVMNQKNAFSNSRTSGLVIVTASDDGHLRVFGCC